MRPWHLSEYIWRGTNFSCPIREAARRGRQDSGADDLEAATSEAGTLRAGAPVTGVDHGGASQRGLRRRMSSEWFHDLLALIVLHRFNNPDQLYRRRNRHACSSSIISHQTSLIDARTWNSLSLCISS